ncbi:DUF2798 domain-containing protein [Ferrimonas lipolytica]|uniref:DUF2798 domain-containing protein n=1 Tax=Ferrimonas lipolytica TaxID=2724191 RepID=A0A6H1UA57_9GAMM|nr:DUF2798 domain-containing protein [Ferrimonas lipolytica]QIZ75708.1 DUF2798 domain-containing protein [Ferrimonas lipolytica]
MTRKQKLFVDITCHMVIVMCMTLAVTTINTGIDAALLKRWMRSFAIAFPLVTLLHFTLLPFMRKQLVKLFVK